ncbi:MAG: DUF1800 domain-containing protein [Gemmatimonadaceae bacterium]|nr:DUF1800 domain-containing protein [Gemmatimonadaceae bacterium]
MGLTRGLKYVLFLNVLGCASSGTPVGRATVDVRGLPMPDAAMVAAREQTADQQVLHALNRLSFGARPGDVQSVRELGVDRWIAAQLEPERIADSAADAVIARYATLTKPLPTLLDEYPPNPVLRRLARQGAAGMPRDSVKLSRADSLEVMGARRKTQLVGQELVSARVARAVVSERQLDEVLTDFWLNHFNVFAGKSASMRHYLVAYERDAVRPHVLGKFRTLLGAVARSPAMLYYLDNWQSQADSTQPRLVSPRVAQRVQRRYAQRAPALRNVSPMRRDSILQRVGQRRRGLNENYARELMELHTLGVDGGYTQADVTEAARVLTGWTIERPNESGAFRFNPLVHDAGSKRVLGTVFPAGQGEAEGDRLLDLLAKHPATATFIATKLAQRFVSDTPPAALVQRAAETFRRTDGDLREVVRTIVTSEEFFSAAAWRSKVKSPFEVVVSALRAMDASVDTTARSAALVARLGQGIYQHQAPNGWPETGDGWINTGAILNRINFGMAIASGSVPGVTVTRWPLYATLDSLPREQQVDGVVRALLGGDVSADMRSVLLSGDHPMLAQAQAQAAVIPDSSAMMSALSPPPPAAMPAARPDRGTASGSAGTTVTIDRTTRLARGMGPGVRFNGSGAPQGLAQIIGLAIGSPEFQRR